jgi:rod shape-determining protein MreC
VAKRTSHTWVLGVLIVVLLALAILEPSYGWRVREWLSPNGTAQTDDATLAAENQALKAEIAKLQVVQSQLPQAPAGYIRAMVYSRYPLNFKNEILLDAGSNQGVVAGKAVMFQGIFIGVVKNVFKDESLAQTVFDSSFRIPVRLGRGGFDGLLEGGSYPRVSSVSKSAPINEHDIVSTAAAGLPYGLPVGTVSATSTSGDNLFQQAVLSFGYDINNIQTVLIAQ